MENLLQEEMSKLCRMLAKSGGQPIELNCTMNVAIVNALWSILVGESLDFEDENLAKVVHALDLLIHGSSPVSPLVAVLPHPAMVKTY